MCNKRKNYKRCFIITCLTMLIICKALCLEARAQGESGVFISAAVSEGVVTNSWSLSHPSEYCGVRVKNAGDRPAIIGLRFREYLETIDLVQIPTTLLGGTRDDVNTYAPKTTLYSQPPVGDYIDWVYGNVISESAWDGAPVARWIFMDVTEPGLFQWGEMLKPGEETTSLLESVSLMTLPDNRTLYYDIFTMLDIRPAGLLNIQKIISGNAASTSDEFAFTVTLDEPGGHVLAGSYTYIGSGGAADGVLSSGGTVRLRGGQSVTIDGIPAQTHYKVIENDANQNGYQTSSSGDEGIIGGEPDFDDARFIFIAPPPYIINFNRIGNATAEQNVPMQNAMRVERPDTTEAAEIGDAIAIFTNVKNAPITPPTETVPPGPEPPVIEPPVTDTPITEPPVIEPPVTELPDTSPPLGELPDEAEEVPKTLDVSILLYLIMFVASATGLYFLHWRRHAI